MIYFDNAATGGRKPDRVLCAVKGAMSLCANPGRSGHKLSLACANKTQACRNLLSDYFDGYGFDRVAFTKNCTEALNIAMLGCLKKGDHVVTTCLEHNSVLRPLEYLKKQGMIEYSVCPLKNGEICANDLLGLLRENTRMVIITLASNVTGYTPPMYELKERLPKNVLLVCDGAQAGGHFPLSMQKLGIDALALAGHKGLFALQGIGALLFSERLNPAPLIFGGTGSLSVSLNQPDFYPDALESGTLNYPAICSLYEGLQHLRANAQKISDKIFSLTKYLYQEFKRLEGCKLFSKPNACGILSFAHEKYDSQTLSQILSDEYDIAVRGGLHCAPLIHQALGSSESGLVRVSLSAENSKAEIDELIFALEELS
ncbi:MAG: aminotransferase class V-fold PLP-dependent enzyme [Clostridia bacterium]|nr:aminotransferase class V-fold PLP-dependent enzyme [Clostridia bacterium]